MNHFTMRRLVVVLSTIGLLSTSLQVFASGYQIWEQDASSVTNYHAGYAAEANDATVAWYNPAAIPRIKNQQVVFGASAIQTNFRYSGSVGVTENSPTLDPVPGISPITVTFNSVSSQGGTFNVVPNLQYVAPISDWIGFGFSVDVPFGLKTSYGRTSPLRYAATLASITVVDISPSLGMKITDKASIGAGLDIQRAYAELNNVAALINPNPFVLPRTIDPAMDTTSKNKTNDTGYGFRLGYLYEFTPCTRLGISYYSQVVHHFSGSSKFEGPIADLVNNGPIVSSRSTANVKLPPFTAFSLFNKISPNWAVMGTIIYTQWNTFKNLSLNQVAGVANGTPLVDPSNNLNINIPEHFRNTWNISAGANYTLCDKVILRGGAGYDKSPVRDGYRNVQLPDNDKYAIALGGHYQASKTIGFDAGWTHVFFAGQAKVNPPPQVYGAEMVSTNGHVKGSADVLAAQIVWDIL